MDQFMFPADPTARLRLENQRYQDEIRRAAWRQAQAAERRQRAGLVAGDVGDELVSHPSLAWRTRLWWRSLVHPHGATG